MAYDRYDTRRDRERGRYSDWDRDRGAREDRGFFERAGDEIASWFGDDEAERRRREEERMNRGWGRDRDYDRTYGRDFDRDRYAYRNSSRDFDRDFDRDRYGSSPQRSARDYDRLGYRGQEHDLSYRGGMGGTTNPDYMSATGPSFGYGGTYGAGTSSGYGSGEFGREFEGQGYRRNESRDSDRHYHAWRQRQLDELDRDYDRYNRERQERFENDFGSWRQNRMSKRQHLNGIREHMDVVGSDGETIGKVDCVRGDHIVLTRSDSPDNRHHAIDCSMVQTVEGDQVRLDMPAEEAKSRWEDAENRGFFGRNENEETNLNRSFAGTYEH
jgi:hypothetical protein